MISNSDLIKMKESSKLIEKEIRKKFRVNRSYVYAINQIGEMHVRMDKLVNKVKSEGVRFECKSGCSYCCSQKVEILAPEVFYIAKKLKLILSNKELSLLVESLEKYSSQTKNLAVGVCTPPCPMLKHGLCSIYDFRPMTCRKCNSCNVELCQDPLAYVPEHGEIFLNFTAIIYGFKDAFNSRNLSSEFYEFVPALLIALTDDADIKWSKGHTVFDSIPEVKY